MRTSSRLRNTSIAQRIVSVVSALALIVGAAACGSSTRTATSPTPPKCQVTLSSSSSVIGSSGGAGAVDVTTTPECTWTASSDASWISGRAPVSGQGNGRVNYQVPANTVVSSRQGDIIVNDNCVRVQRACNRADAVVGFKWNVVGTWLLSANVLKPLTSAGLNANWVPSLTFDYSFGH